MAKLAPSRCLSKSYCCWSGDSGGGRGGVGAFKYLYRNVLRIGWSSTELDYSRAVHPLVVTADARRRATYARKVLKFWCCTLTKGWRVGVYGLHAVPVPVNNQLIPVAYFAQSRTKMCMNRDRDKTRGASVTKGRRQRAAVRGQFLGVYHRLESYKCATRWAHSNPPRHAYESAGRGACSTGEGTLPA